MSNANHGTTLSDTTKSRKLVLLQSEFLVPIPEYEENQPDQALNAQQVYSLMVENAKLKNHINQLKVQLAFARAREEQLRASEYHHWFELMKLGTENRRLRMQLGDKL